MVNVLDIRDRSVSVLGETKRHFGSSCFGSEFKLFLRVISTRCASVIARPGSTLVPSFGAPNLDAGDAIPTSRAAGGSSGARGD